MKSIIINKEIENVLYSILNNFHIHLKKIFGMILIREKSFCSALHRNGTIVLIDLIERLFFCFSDEAKRQLKQNVRSLSALFKPNNCLETTTESPPFTRLTPFGSYLQIRKSILSLSYHDQYYVTNRVSKLLIERLTNFIERRTSRLPWLDDVAFLFELMEKSLNLYGLIQTCVDILRIFSRIESMGSLKASPGMYSYRFELYLEITSIFRFYTPVLILTPTNMIQVFEK